MSDQSIVEFDVIEWRASEFDSQKEYGYVGELRCFSLTRARDRLGNLCWILTPNLPCPKGVIGRNPEGFSSRPKAEKQALDVVTEFARLWSEGLRKAETARQEKAGPATLAVLEASRDSC